MAKAELFRLMDRTFRRVQTGMECLHQGLWLGVLDADDLARATMLRYSQAGTMYADEAHNTSGLFDWEKAMVERYFCGCRSVLLGAAGGGREAIALARDYGLHVTAFECNSELLERGRQLAQAQNVRTTCLHASPNELPPDLNAGFDAAIVGWGGFSHIAGATARVRFLTQLAAQVRPGGPLLLSFLTRGEGRRDALVAKLANTVRLATRAARQVEPGDMLRFGEFTHLFSRAELTAEVGRAGWSVEYYSEHPYPHAVALRASAATPA